MTCRHSVPLGHSQNGPSPGPVTATTTGDGLRSSAVDELRMDRRRSPGHRSLGRGNRPHRPHPRAGRTGSLLGPENGSPGTPSTHNSPTPCRRSLPRAQTRRRRGEVRPRASKGRRWLSRGSSGALGGRRCTRVPPRSRRSSGRAREVVAKSIGIAPPHELRVASFGVQRSTSRRRPRWVPPRSNSPLRSSPVALTASQPQAFSAIIAGPFAASDPLSVPRPPSRPDLAWQERTPGPHTHRDHRERSAGSRRRSRLPSSPAGGPSGGRRGRRRRRCPNESDRRTASRPCGSPLEPSSSESPCERPTTGLSPEHPHPP